MKGRKKKKSCSNKRLVTGMMRLYEKGWTYERIGKWFGVTKESVRQNISGLVVPRKPGNRRPLPKDVEDQIVSDGKSKKSIGEISNELKVSPFVVKRVLTNAGIRPERTRKITLSDVERMTSLYRSGESYQRIAKEFKVSATAVFRRLRGLVSSRPRGPLPKNPISAVQKKSSDSKEG